MIGDLLAFTPSPPTNRTPSAPAADGVMPPPVAWPAGGTWADLTAVATGDLPTARAGHSLVAAGDRLYSFGGYTNWPGVSLVHCAGFIHRS